MNVIRVILLLAVIQVFLSPSAMAKTEIHMFQDYTIALGVNPVVIETGSIIPSGKIVKMRTFGCAIVDTAGDIKQGYVAVQWGNGGSWTTIRACTGFGELKEINREFTGDGAKRFRIVGLNGSLLGSRIIAYWFEARIAD